MFFGKQVSLEACRKSILHLCACVGCAVGGFTVNTVAHSFPGVCWIGFFEGNGGKIHECVEAGDNQLKRANQAARAHSGIMDHLI